MATMTYASSGVDYDPIDGFKRMCQAAAWRTAENPKRLGFRDVAWSRGESAYLLEQFTSFYGTQKLAFVDEGLGTKERVAWAMWQLTGQSYYRNVMQCTLAMTVNDIATLAHAVAVSLHVAAGSSDWFKNETICRDMAEGYAEACMLARCAWGCGETPVLKDAVIETAIVLTAAAVGVVPTIGIRGIVQDGDAIVLLESSGIHANGLTMARKIAEKLPKGYRTEMPDGRTYGETLLDPTHLYGPLIEDYLDAGIPINYAINITGHGWRKLMRAKGAFEYTIVNMPSCPPVFDFIQEHGPVERREMFAQYNQGAGYALIVPADKLQEMSQVEPKHKPPFKVHVAGYVRQSDQKRVVIKPEGIVFEEDELQVR